MKSIHFQQTFIKLFAFILIISMVFACKKSASSGEGIALTGDPAIDGLTSAIQETPNDPELYLQRSQIFYERQAYDQAIQDLVSVMKLDSMNLRAHHLLADV